MVHGQVGKNLAVQFDIIGLHRAHELGIRHSMQTGPGIDTGDPQGAEIAFFVSAIAVLKQHRFLYRVLGYGPDVLASSVIALGLLHDFFSAGSRGN